MSKIVLCPDSFKGSLSAKEVVEIMAEKIKRLCPASRLVCIPLADGGEGTIDVLSDTIQCEKAKVNVHDSLGNIISAEYLIYDSGKKCLIESASAVGLDLIEKSKRQPMKMSSRGVGELILDAAFKGCEEIFVSLGGTGTCDGGMGLLNELGFKFYDHQGIRLVGKGEDLTKIGIIDAKDVNPCLKKIKLKAVCDVSAPLYGKKGAAFVFAPQKGASPDEIEILDAGLKNFAVVSQEAGLTDFYTAMKPGSGAAGGMGFAMTGLLNAEYISGVDFVMEAVDFENRIKDADLIVTGEGRIDKQSLMGKVGDGVLKRAERHRIPVVGLGGKVENADLLEQAGFSAVYEISDPNKSLEENMNKETTLLNIENALEKCVSMFGLNSCG